MVDNTQPNQGSDDTFSDAERAFFESGGKVTEGLTPVAEPERVEPAGEAKPETVTKPVKTAAEEVEPGEVALDDTGRVRDAKTGRYVPLPVLQKEREEHKSTRKDRDELRDKWNRLEAKWNLQQEILSTDDGEEPTAGKPKARAEEAPDPEKDIFAHNRFLQKKIDELAQKLDGTAKQTNETIAADRAQRSYESDVRRFSAVTPDYGDAYKHLLTARAQTLVVTSKHFRNADGTPNIEALKKQLNEDEKSIRDAALTDGESPAERMYGLAKVYGYAPKAAANGSAQTNGKTPAQEKVEQIEAGKEGARTLNGAGGGAKPALTLDEYLAMDDGVVARRLREEPAFKKQVEALHGRR